MKLAFGYNTNGFAHHRLEEALAIIAELGYDGVALTLDVHHFDPFQATAREVMALRRRLQRLKLRCVIETGARFLLDPRRKHEPTLISHERAGRELRLKFLRRAVEIAVALDAEAVSFWSGVKAPNVKEKQAWSWLAEGCTRLDEFATKKGVPLAFEPEPGMLVETMMDYERLRKGIGGRVLPVDETQAGTPVPPIVFGETQSRTPTSAGKPVPQGSFGLTLDVGHVFCSETKSFNAVFAEHASRIKNMHIEDIRGKKHEHLMFGEGELDFRKILAPIKASGYLGLINVELSRDSHRAPEVARRSIEFLRGVEAKL